MDDHNTKFGIRPLPTRNIIRVLTSREGDQLALWIALTQPSLHLAELVALQDPPWLQLNQSQFNKMLEFRWI